MTIDEKVLQMGLEFPNIPASKGIYKRCLVQQGSLYVSGHVSINTDGSYITGKVGENLSEEEGKRAARQCGLGILASIRHQMGTLNQVDRVIKIFGMVNAAGDFAHHALVINGCSELFAEIWGEDRGIGVRSAVGMGSLPNHVAVEIEAIFAVVAK